MPSPLECILWCDTSKIVNRGIQSQNFDDEKYGQREVHVAQTNLVVINACSCGCDKKHNKLHAPLVKLYSMHGCAKLIEWNLIGPMAQKIRSIWCLLLLMSFPNSAFHLQYSGIHFFNLELFIDQQLPHVQHSLQPPTLPKFPQFPCTHCVLICTKEWHHSKEPNMSSKCKHREKDDQVHITRQRQFLLLLPSIWTIHTY